VVVDQAKIRQRVCRRDQSTGLQHRRLGGRAREQQEACGGGDEEQREEQNF
jgi:hypothetical protein